MSEIKLLTLVSGCNSDVLISEHPNTQKFLIFGATKSIKDFVGNSDFHKPTLQRLKISETFKFYNLKFLSVGGTLFF